MVSRNLEQKAEEIIAGLKGVCQNYPKEREGLLNCLSDPRDIKGNFYVYSIAQGRRECLLTQKLEKLTAQIKSLIDYDSSDLWNYYCKYALKYDPNGQNEKNKRELWSKPKKVKSAPYCATKVLEMLIWQAGLIGSYKDIKKE